MSWIYFQEDWAFNQKCTFDGAARCIIVGQHVTELDIKIDVYSDWKEWVTIRDNSKFHPAIRTTGGDPVGGGQYTGDVFFLINGWKLLFDPRLVKVAGVLFSDDFDTAYWDYDKVTPVYPARVSSIVNTISVGGSGASAAELWNYVNRTLSSAPAFNGPSAIEIRQEIDSNSSKLTIIANQTDSVEASLSSIDVKVDALPADVWNYSLRELSSSMTPEEFWNFLLTSPMATGSAGEKLKQVLTTGNFLALK